MITCDNLTECRIEPSSLPRQKAEAPTTQPSTVRSIMCIFSIILYMLTAYGCMLFFSLMMVLYACKNKYTRLFAWINALNICF